MLLADVYYVWLFSETATFYPWNSIGKETEDGFRFKKEVGKFFFM